MATSPSSVSAVGTRRFPIGALLLLALGVFATVTSESLPAGLLTEMAGDLRAEPLQIGLLVSVWAFVVIVTSIPLARATASIDRRVVIALALAVFAVANGVTAFAPTYAFAFGTRVVAAAAHGLFWAIVMVYASSLLDDADLGRGLAVVTGGGIAASVFGTPAAVVLAQATSWRIPFLVIGIGMLALAAVLMLWMPASIAPRVAPGERTPIRHDRTLPPVLAFGVVGVLTGLAQFTSFTYIRPYLADSAGVAAQWASALLFAFGIAGLVGNAIAGYLGDRFPRSALSFTLLLFSLAFAVLAVFPHSIAAVVGALALWGAAAGAMFPLIQTALLRTASDDLRAIASAAIIVFFNIGIGGGSWLGGLLVDGPAGAIVNVTVSSAAMLLAAMGAVVASVLASRSRP